nr:E3 ubiquitin-protein ligase RING1-like [Ipomoea trifida]
MSQAGISGGGGEGVGRGGGPQNYFCYHCERTVTITPLPNSELVCPNCNDTFLEEAETAPPTNPSNNNPFGFPGADAFPFGFGGGGGGGGVGGEGLVFSTASSGGGIALDDLSSLFGGMAAGRSPNQFHPLLFLQNYLQTMRASGANIQLVFENSGGGGVPGNLGDYFVGPGLEQLIQQLMENDPNRYGTPPAAKSAVEGLPDIKITQEMLASDSSQCAVCKDSFELDEEAKQMPCKHIYHKDCIMPWLELHNSCPVCRYELPTDDPDYENRRNSQQQTRNNNNSFGLGIGGLGGGGNQENPQTPRTVERRFRVSLPWLFGGFGSPAETSNSGGGTGNNNGGSTGNNNGGNDNNRDDTGHGPNSGS